MPPLEKEILRDAAGLSVLVTLISAVLMWGTILG
jgi:hypothetical protein